MERDIPDLIDRYCISSLKKERIGSVESIKEFDAFGRGIKEVKDKYPQYNWQQFITMMIDIHKNIWLLESGIKSGYEKLKNPLYLLDEDNKETLSKIGLTTVLIRGYNHLRIQLKNIIGTLTNTGFLEQKRNHLSE